MAALLVRTLLVIGAVLLGLAYQAQAGDEGQDNVLPFKQYLSTEPSIRRLYFTRTYVSQRRKGPQASAPAERYVAAYCTEGYFVRELKPGDNELAPLSTSNRMHSALLVGKNQNVSWQINGFGVGKSINPMVNNPDPYATFSQNSQTILEGVVNLSSQHAKPGSFQWSGDDFIAAPSHFMRQLHPELSELKGSIQVKDGRVVQMYVSHSGLYRFEYEGSTNRPGWFPARIMHVGGPNFFIDEVIAIEKVEFSPLENVRELTLAETHILPEVALVTVYSNSTLVSSFNPDDTNAARIVRAQFDDLSLSNKIRNRRLPIVVGLIALTVVVPIGCRLLASRPGRIK